MAAANGSRQAGLMAYMICDRYPITSYLKEHYENRDLTSETGEIH